LNATKISSSDLNKAANIVNEVLDEMVDINCYRNGGMLHNDSLSTCPILPKFHLTYGEPIER